MLDLTEEAVHVEMGATACSHPHPPADTGGQCPPSRAPSPQAPRRADTKGGPPGKGSFLLTFWGQGHGGDSRQGFYSPRPTSRRHMVHRSLCIQHWAAWRRWGWGREPRTSPAPHLPPLPERCRPGLHVLASQPWERPPARAEDSEWIKQLQGALGRNSRGFVRSKGGQISVRKHLSFKKIIQPQKQHPFQKPKHFFL